MVASPPDRAQLLDEIQALKSQVSILDAQRARLGRMAEMMNALSVLSTELNTLDAERIKDLAVTRIAALARAKAAALFSADSRTGMLTLERHSDGALLKGAGPFAVSEDTLLARAVDAQDLLVIRDLSAYAAVLGEPLRLCPALRDSGRSAILAPLRASETLVGVLALMDGEDGGNLDTVNDLAPLQQAAQLLASAWRNVQLYQQVMTQSRTDSLTGLLNRRALRERLDQEIQRSRRYGHPLAILMIDVDHFKTINDTHGHKEGDVVLCALARILQEQVRTVDSVARYGGDEFFVLLPHTDLPGAKVVGNRFLERVRAWTSPAGAKTTLSIGVATLAGSATPADLVAQADEALYRAKAAGRDAMAAAAAP